MTAALTTRPFGYDLAAARRSYDEHGYFHAPGGVVPELMSTISAQIAVLMGSDENQLDSWRYPDKKEQFLWELPEGLTVEALCRVVAETTGMDPEKTVLSERHLKVYSATAAEFPPPHKDRSASTVTVGIGIDSPPDSRLVLWPWTETTFNPFPTAAEWRGTRRPDELPEVVTADEPNVEIDLQRGDIVLFKGANYYHERHRPASTSVLYLKFNDRGLDPLGEDPRTLRAEERSRTAERSGITTETVVFVSPRLISIRTEDLMPDLGVVETARTFGSECGIRLDGDEARVLRELARRGALTIADLGVGVVGVERLIQSGLVLIG